MHKMIVEIKLLLNLNIYACCHFVPLEQFYFHVLLCGGKSPWLHIFVGKDVGYTCIEDRLVCFLARGRMKITYHIYCLSLENRYYLSPSALLSYEFCAWFGNSTW